ncbi:hypothetical protein EJ08DRAFT_245993 [Tothia fuscella]|uniref:Uncharacterized protein n=1 Tax=Tothia fuscella TaxID=1048955 RepID=A0A9P4NQJ4_9PEZI|nr:hypothetical protein EJ08DRAFT_245993 [Tothia fuscella]
MANYQDYRFNLAPGPLVSRHIYDELLASHRSLETQLFESENHVRKIRAEKEEQDRLSNRYRDYWLEECNEREGLEGHLKEEKSAHELAVAKNEELEYELDEKKKRKADLNNQATYYFELAQDAESQLEESESANEQL